MEGQLTIFEINNARLKELQEKYPIPRHDPKVLAEEGWSDDWHYTDLEVPEEAGIYYCIHMGFNSDYYHYTYMAYAYGQWWAYAGYGTKWLLVHGERRAWMKPFAWVRMPDLYMRKDEHYTFLFENFVRREDWEYEQRIGHIGGN